ncbi:hypothetical protein FPK29_00270 [Bifidobacterium polysaccharolyticum]|uniref:RCC1-like domain-containing protein n=4 Tax=Bifidobacterium TaxID=1678 RepID=A0A556RBD2_9BIFI|nr:hypothetical protein FPK29_00270 [Bifidobacterium polysaccharolyticum]
MPIMRQHANMHSRRAIVVSLLLAIILPASLIMGGLAMADTASGESSVPEPTRLEQTAAGQQADPSANAPTLPANPAGPQSPLPSPLNTASPLTTSQPAPKKPGDTGIQSKTTDSLPQTRAAYTVAFNDPDGNTSTPSQSVPSGGQASRPKDPSRDGYLFNGWFTGNTAVAYDFSQPVTGNITLTAKWTRITSSWSLKPTSGPAEGGTRITLTTPTTSGIRFSHISTGIMNSLAVGSDGNLYYWGAYGGKTVSSNRPVIVKPPEEGDRFTQAGSGNGFSVALGSDGNLYSMGGGNERGQLGNGTTTTSYDKLGKAPLPTGVRQFTQISVGFGHSLALDSDGNLYSWGRNDCGQLGYGTTDDNSHATPSKVNLPAGVTEFTQISAGTDYSLAMGSDGNLYSWGETVFNALGRSSSTTPANQPGKVTMPAGVRQFTQISAGYTHSLALGSDGNLYSWGNNTSSQLGRTPTSTMPANQPGKVTMPTGVKQFTQISAGNGYSLAMGSDGNLYSWGDNTNGQLGRNPSAAKDGTPGKVAMPAGITITQASAPNMINGYFSLALGSDGNLYSWGDNSASQLGRDTSGKFDSNPGMVDFPEKPKPTGVKFGGTAGTSLTDNKDGTWSVSTPPHAGGKTDVTINWNMNGQQPDAHLTYTYINPYTVTFDSAGGKPTPGQQRITEGRQATRPTSSPSKDGFLFDGWFLKDAEGKSDVAYDFSQPVTADITLVAHWSPADTGGWSISPDKGNVLGGQQATITPPKLGRGIRFNQISAGGYEIGMASGFSVGVASDGNAYAWGSNQYGQLGQGSTSSRRQKTPVRVPLPAGVDSNFTYTQAVAGGYHVLAVGSDGIVYSWGANNRGQLGDNTTSDRSKPQPVKGADGQPFKAVQVSAGAYDSAAIDLQGRVYTWGSECNSGGSYSLSRSTPTLVQDPSGSNEGLQAVQVAVEWSFIMALDKNGTVYAWGYNDYGQLGNGTSDFSYTNQPTPVQYPGKTGQPLQAKQISAGSWSALAIDTTDTVWAWGWNDRGQLGNGSTADRQYSPVRVQDPTGTNQGFQASQICTGTNHTLAIDKEGTAWAWGDNGYGRLGNGTVKNARTPTQINGFLQQNNADTGFKAARISAGSQHSLAIGQDGNAYSWGDNQYGQLGTGNDTARSSNPTPVPFNSLLITGVSFDKTVVNPLQQNSDGSVSFATPVHNPGQADVVVDWTLGGVSQTQEHLAYTYEGVLPLTGGNGSMILLLAVGLLAAAGAVAAGRHRRETRALQA